MKFFFAGTLLLCFLAACVSQNEMASLEKPASAARLSERPGQKSDHSILLPNQWSLRPAGRQIDLGDFPVNIALHPGGKFAAILHSGHGQHEIIVINILAEQVVSHTPLEEAFYGIEFSRDGLQLFSSGAGSEVIHSFSFADGQLQNHRPIALRDAKIRGVPAGLALNNDASRLYIANVWGHRISQLDLPTEKNVEEISLGATNVVVTSNLARPPSDPELAAATKRAEANLDPTQVTDPFPYACRLDEKKQRLYVSLWAQAVVAVIDLKSSRIIARWPTQEHPNEMLLTRDGKFLYAANANRNTVTVFDTAAGKSIETIFAAMFPEALPGSTPNSLALTPDEKTLFVANACNNNLAVFDVAIPGKSKSLGFIPVGWYPTSVRVSPDGKKLLVANGKGLSSKANPNGPQPGRRLPAGTVLEYIGGLFKGTLSVIDLPARNDFARWMTAHTAEAYRCLPRKVSPENIPSLAGNPVPRQVGQASPIKYVIYIIKENRTYDQVLGDMPQGNGDPNLCLFGERVTPNHHKLAREFVLFDNFYVDAEVSADGHEWSMGAYATDFVEKFWPMSYGHNKKHGKYPYPAEGKIAIAEPASGYLWDKAAEAGVSYRSYAEFVIGGKTSADLNTVRLKTLQGHFDPRYRVFDLDYPDVKRAERFISELKRFEQEGDMPRLQIARLGNDHTVGTSVGKLTPTALVGDNDLALGRVVDAVSHSKFWPQTAIFVLEDDAQNGPDHIDAHRSPAFVISPYTRRGSVDSTMYSTTSLLRTIELILGLKAMTQFDSAAMPMYNAFQSTPDARPYEALPANVDLNERNGRMAWGSERARKMDFSREDAADDLLLNEMIWRSIRGSNHPMPPPTRAAFVFAREKSDDDD